MTREEKIYGLFRQICERCEGFSVEDNCENKKDCPVYELYKMAKQKIVVYRQNVWEVPPSPKPEMI